jgi:tetratricopeptide (TPR) repeat protein
MPEATTKTENSNRSKYSLLDEEIRAKIISSLQGTLYPGCIIGLVGIIGFCLNLKSFGWKTLFFSILLASASYVAGFFLGFLFGIPKRNVEKETAYNLSTNLVDISDWLTKIIIGLGLIEIKKIPNYLLSIGSYVQIKTNTDSSMQVFVICCIVFFSIFGLYYGYNYMRLYLSEQFKIADDNLLEKKKELSVKAEELRVKNLSPENINEEDKETISQYAELLKSTKKEEDYTFEDWYFKGINAYDKKDYNSAIAYMQNAIKANPNHNQTPDAYLYIGNSFYNLQLYREAIGIFDKIISEYKNYFSINIAYNNRGLNYHALNMFEKAVEDFKNALRLNYKHPNVYHNLGYSLLKLGELNEALDILSIGLELDPKQQNSWYNRACVYSLLNDSNKAIDDLAKAFALKPTLKDYAKSDEYLKSIRDNPAFKIIVEN